MNYTWSRGIWRARDNHLARSGTSGSVAPFAGNAGNTHGRILFRELSSATVRACRDASCNVTVFASNAVKACCSSGGGSCVFSSNTGNADSFGIRCCAHFYRGLARPAVGACSHAGRHGVVLASNAVHASGCSSGLVGMLASHTARAGGVVGCCLVFSCATSRA